MRIAKKCTSLSRSGLAQCTARENDLGVHLKPWPTLVKFFPCQEIFNVNMIKLTIKSPLVPNKL